MQNDAWSDGNGSVSGRAKHALDVLPCDDPFWITHSLHLQMHKTHIWFDSTHPECVEIGCICPHCVTLHSKVGTKQWGKPPLGEASINCRIALKWHKCMEMYWKELSLVIWHDSFLWLTPTQPLDDWAAPKFNYWIKNVWILFLAFQKHAEKIRFPQRLLFCQRIVFATKPQASWSTMVPVNKCHFDTAFKTAKSATTIPLRCLLN